MNTNNDNINNLDQEIKQAVTCLKEGKLVAFPTETVYGLGADAMNPDAVAKVFAAKGRPITHPLIVHIGDATQLDDWATNIPPAARILAKNFWPGPLTMILTKKSNVPSIVSGGLDTIAIRVPRHPITLELLRQFGSGIVGPSANSYGKITPTRTEHLHADLGKKIDFILDGGPCQIGIESTIVYFDHPDQSDNAEVVNVPHIVRKGAITANDIARVLGTALPNDENNALKLMEKLKSPGSADKHYAPNKPLYLINEPILEFISANELKGKDELRGKEIIKIAVLSFSEYPGDQGFPEDIVCSLWQQMPLSHSSYSQQLYDAMWQAQQSSADIILVESPPPVEAWFAVLDRLTRASTEL